MSSEEQAKAQYESICELVERMNTERGMEAIHEDILSVQVRSDWQSPGEKLEPYEWELLLCTGGPAVRIIGTLNDHKEPDTAKLQHQDWLKPWTEYHEADEAILLQYASCFYFGE
jgi:hypothetical protein